MSALNIAARESDELVENISPPAFRAPPRPLGEKELQDALPSAGVAERGGSREADVKERAPALVKWWRATDIAWPTPLDALQRCQSNVDWLRRHGVDVACGVDAFDMKHACRETLDIKDMDSVGLVIWCGMHPRRHDGHNDLQTVEIRQHLKWSHNDFIAAALDAISSTLPQATVVACDAGTWADNAAIGLDHKPLATFRTTFGTARDGSRFQTEASGFDGQHIRTVDTETLTGTALVGPYLKEIILGAKKVDIPQLAILTGSAGLHVIFLGEYTFALARHCLDRAIAAPYHPSRMLCEEIWMPLPVPSRSWKRGRSDVWTYEEYRQDARKGVIRKIPSNRWVFSNLHAAQNWKKAVPRGRGSVSNFGDWMEPARRNS